MLDQYKAILFDFDFTLGDSSRGIYECVNHGLTANGFEPAPEPEIHRRIGQTLRSIFQEFTANIDEEHFQLFHTCFQERAVRIMTSSTVLYPGVTEMVQQLHLQEKYLGVVSTKYRARLEEILDKFELREYFSIVIGGEDVENHKPHPEGLLQALDRLTLQPHEALYVGDTTLDAEAAQAAGIPFAAVLTGTTTSETFLPYKPVGIFASVADLAI